MKIVHLSGLRKELQLCNGLQNGAKRENSTTRCKRHPGRGSADDRGCNMMALEFIEEAGLIFALVAVFLLILKILTFSRRRQKRESEVLQARRQVIKRLYLVAKQERSLGDKIG